MKKFMLTTLDAILYNSLVGQNSYFVSDVTSSKKPKLWWQEGLFFFYNISGWIIGPLLLGIIIGKYIDSRLASSPRYLIISIIVAFIITNIGLFLRVKEYSKRLSGQTKSEKHEQNSHQK